MTNFYKIVFKISYLATYELTLLCVDLCMLNALNMKAFTFPNKQET